MTSQSAPLSTPSPSALNLRKPSVYDLPPLYALAMDTSAKFLDDYHEVDISYAQEVLNDPNTLIIDDGYYPVGAAWWTDVLDDLHAEIHLLVKPGAWRRFLSSGLGHEILGHGFKAVGVARQYAFMMHTQTSAIKILKRHGFYSHMPWRAHTKQGGKRVDTIFMELKRSKWESRNDR